MFPVCRVGDKGLGKCSNHSHPRIVTGTIITGSSNHMIDGRQTARVNDLVLLSCGHIAAIVIGSSTVLCNSLNIAHMNSTFSAPGIVGSLIIGSGTFFV